MDKKDLMLIEDRLYKSMQYNGVSPEESTAYYKLIEKMYPIDKEMAVKWLEKYQRLR